MRKILLSASFCLAMAGIAAAAKHRRTASETLRMRCARAVQAREPFRQALRRRIRCVVVERHQCRWRALRRDDVCAPSLALHLRQLDVVQPTVDVLLDSLHAWPTKPV